MNTVTTIQHDGVNYQFPEADKLTVKQLAPILECSEKTIYDMRRAGLPFFGQFCTVQIIRQWQCKNPNWRATLK